MRSNVIVGFPGETRADVAELTRFLTAARLDAIGVFGYSDEDGTEAAGYQGKVRADVIDRRVARMTELVDELMAQRAEERLGETVEVLVEAVTGDGLEGRAAHQAPEVDGATLVIDAPVDAQVGDLVRATVTGTAGVDLTARYLDTADAVARPVVERPDGERGLAARAGSHATGAGASAGPTERRAGVGARSGARAPAGPSEERAG